MIWDDSGATSVATFDYDSSDSVVYTYAGDAYRTAKMAVSSYTHYVPTNDEKNVRVPGWCSARNRDPILPPVPYVKKFKLRLETVILKPYSQFCFVG
ncbi:MAG: hypothetical protein GF411_18925 [Candidatus Lokiarchaeota archaeon]|nr:hypothetical protein [Candidatus Lokiarchaeota archaeon]